MKSVIALLVMSFSVIASAEPTKLGMYIQYEDAGAPERENSTVAAPLSAGYLVGTPICFEGNAADVPVIIQAMIDSTDGSNLVILPTYTTDSVDTTLAGNPTIVTNFQLAWKDGSKTYNYKWDFVRPCARKSKSTTK